MRFDIPLRFPSGEFLGEVIRTVNDLQDYDVAFDLSTLELDARSGAYIEADLPEENWPEVRAYIEVSTAVEVDEETLLEWADEPDTEVIE